MVSKTKMTAKTDWLVSGNVAGAIERAIDQQITGQAHGRVSALIRQILDEVRESTVHSVNRGDLMARKMSSVLDDIIRTLYNCINKDHTQLPPYDEITILAIGGYGRGTLAPFSDVDLLFLHNAKKPEEDAGLKLVLDKILYPLWDGGIKVGHSVHTPQSALQFATEDINGRTAYLESRLLTGSLIVYEDFQKRYEKLRKSTGRKFVTAKLNEQEDRHQRFAQSRFLVEPDVKEGKGGLRDIHSIGWLYHYIYGHRIDLVIKGTSALSKEDRKSLEKAHRFFMMVRAHIHMVRGRDDNHLSFDIQPEIAERLGYRSRKGMTGAERLMQDYFVTTTQVGRLMRVFCARLEEQNNKLMPKLPKIMPKRLLNDGIKTKMNIRIRTGRFDFNNAAKARKAPIDWFRLMHAFSRQDKFDIHPNALSLISTALPLVDAKVREDKNITALFRNMLVDAQDILKTMRLLAETGLLVRYIPAFRKLTGRIVYGLYRRFTLDEQTYQALSVLKDIQNGAMKKDHPIASTILGQTTDHYPFFLAILFHEFICTIEDGDKKKCERLVAQQCVRLGLESDIAKDVAWVCAHQLLMIDTIERRLIVDSGTIEQFCEKLSTWQTGSADTLSDQNSPQRCLDLLLVLTVCHLRVVGLNSWDDSTKKSLQTLYENASLWMKGGEKALIAHQEKQIDLTRKEIDEHLGAMSQKDKDWLFERLEGKAIHIVEPALWGRFAPLMLNAERQGLPGAVTVALREDGDIEAITFGDDRDGLLTDLAGAVAMMGLSLRSVRALTTTDGKIIDIFVLQSIDGSPLQDISLEKRVHQVLLETVRSKPVQTPKINKRLGDRRSIFSVPSSVHLDLEASEDCLVVEAIGLDRPGLLYHLTRALTEIGVIIRSAHVGTYGERAVDSFYLQDAPGYKITNKRRLLSIERRLYQVLNAGGEA